MACNSDAFSDSALSRRDPQTADESPPDFRQALVDPRRLPERGDASRITGRR
jgi:hypothetical protein